jgi:cupin superfamily acireductone dioxygenase involved in methionine salvage
MTIDPSVRIGDLITLVVISVGGLGFLWSLRGDLKMLARDVKMQGVKIEKLEAIIVKQAAQDERLNALDRRIDELRHWRGFVNQDVDGMYNRYGKVENIP